MLTNPIVEVRGVSHSYAMKAETITAVDEDADVRFFRSDNSDLAGSLGVTFCNKWTQIPGICAGFHVVLNADLLTSTSYRQKTACHEVCHSVGLSHGPTYGGCMISGLSTINYYSSHHVDHINNYYQNK